MTKLVLGVGLNDKKYPVFVNGSPTKEYNLWIAMLDRCYGKKLHKRQPTYAQCEVSESFKNYSFFYSWCVQQLGFRDDGWQLDKDILLKNNKIYSEENCVFVPQEINSFFKVRINRRGLFSIGVYKEESTGKFISKCSIDGKLKHLGTFDNHEEAFLAYKKHKEQACKNLAEKWKNQIDHRVYDAMINWSV